MYFPYEIGIWSLQYILRKFNMYLITFWWLKYKLKSSSFICINCGMYLDMFQKLYFRAIYVNRYCKYISTLNYRRLSKIQLKLEERSTKKPFLEAYLHFDWNCTFFLLTYVFKFKSRFHHFVCVDKSKTKSMVIIYSSSIRVPSYVILKRLFMRSVDNKVLDISPCHVVAKWKLD